MPVQREESSQIPWKTIALVAGGAAIVGGIGYAAWSMSRCSTGDTINEDAPSQPAVADEPRTPLQEAVQLKNKGNKYFKARQFDKAIECYTSALATCPPDMKKEMSVFFQNRAAAHTEVGNMKQVVDDCSSALKYDKRYVKALVRRSKARMELEQLEGSLEDVTAAIILEQFQNQTALAHADVVLKRLGAKIAHDKFKSRPPAMPSKTFVKTYLSSFKNDPVFDVTPTKEERNAKTANKRTKQQSEASSISESDADVVQRVSHEQPVTTATNGHVDVDGAAKDSETLVLTLLDSMIDSVVEDEERAHSPAGDVDASLNGCAAFLLDPNSNNERPSSGEDGKVASANGGGEDEKQEVTWYEKARAEVNAQKFTNVIKFCSQHIEEATVAGSERFVAEAYLLRGTFNLIQSDPTAAKCDLEMVLKLDSITAKVISNALVKRATLRMHSGDSSGALQDFANAEKVDMDNSDIYHHRGQLHLLLDQVDAALADFNKCILLAPDFPIGHVQKAYADYKQAMMIAQFSPASVEVVCRQFSRLVDRFPDCVEAIALYAQTLVDMQRFSEARSYFEKAIKVDPENAALHVHIGLLTLQEERSFAAAIEKMEEALRMDPKCEFAYETLGTLELQKGNPMRAVELFSQAVKLCKTEIEMAQLCSMIAATETQSRVARDLGVDVPDMFSALSAGGGMPPGSSAMA